MSETIGSAYIFIYLYDETGSPIGIKFRRANYAAGEYDYFFFEKNLQGDIVAIYNESGTKVATYTYDAWGKVTTTYVSTNSIERYVANNNPFRYRGYYYDLETGLYYLQSRYYNPTWGRFLNADGYLATGGFSGYNLYTYCLNNPVRLIDSYGTCPYDGTAADFRRLEQDLPPLKCNCKFNELAEKTSVRYNETENIIHTEIDLSVYEDLADLDYYELSRYVDAVNRKIDRLYDVRIPKEQLDAYMSELLLHVEFWDVKINHPLKERCRVVEIDIVCGKVKDPRGHVNFASRTLFGGWYYEENVSSGCGSSILF